MEKKTIIGLVILIVVIAALTSFSFMHFFANSGGEGDGSGKGQAEVNKEIGDTYSLGSFTVNLKGTSGYQFIQASISVEVKSAKVIDELKKRDPQIKDLINTILRDQQIADIEEPGVKTIKNEIEVKINQILTEGKITSVFFTQLVVQ